MEERIDRRTREEKQMARILIGNLQKLNGKALDPNVYETIGVGDAEVNDWVIKNLMPDVTQPLSTRIPNTGLTENVYLTNNPGATYVVTTEDNSKMVTARAVVFNGNSR